MKISSFLLLGFLSIGHAFPAATKPAAFFLAGDSTTAVEGGWGDGFLKLLANGAKGTNFAKSGRTTVSFVSGGFWDQVIAAVKANAASFTPRVTIQFGHNDQKTTANISIDQFKANLKKMVEQVRSAGGIPILVTSLTRRTFDKSTGKVKEDLAPQAKATLEVASETNAQFIDLNKASTAYMNAIGQSNADLYNLDNLPGGDRTHLNPSGEKLFGNMVAKLIGQSPVLELGAQTKGFLAPNAAIVAAIDAGKFILP
ncbi:hypothetical protein HYFRA_00004204 [Hymenoscyphus fraxineus]|uniref:SGNH hydrolase-type esterase domain-containing protein n=1 Tax=Hymenoscyphus fraxineus TaxID=746836 RepID=A0A9N9KMV4_9HELO|nr:hypothetical protein HYFRA_00004204 [Hymenoscyphus fraxineus]